MTTTYEVDTPPPSSAADVAQYLATSYIALSCAAITAEQLIAVDTDYAGTTGWDLQINILDAAAAVKNAARVHDLTKHHGFWKNPHPPQLVLTVLASHHAHNPARYGAVARCRTHLGVHPPQHRGRPCRSPGRNRPHLRPGLRLRRRSRLGSGDSHRRRHHRDPRRHAHRRPHQSNPQFWADKL